MKVLSRVKIVLWCFLFLIIIISGLYAASEVKISFEEAKQKKESQIIKQQTITSKAAKQKAFDDIENRRLTEQVPGYLQKIEKGLGDGSLYPPDSEDITILELSRAKDNRAVPSLIRVLREYAVTLARVDAARALGEIGDKLAVPALKEALIDKDYQVKVNAAIALVKIGEKEAAFPILAKVAKKENINDWSVDIERQLGQKNGAEREEWRQKLTKQYREEKLPGQAIAGLSEIKDEKSIEIIEQTLKDRNVKLRLGASSSLVKLGRESTAIPVLIDIAKDENIGVFVRTPAIGLLAKLKTERVKNTLALLASDKNETIRKKASDALAELKEIK